MARYTRLRPIARLGRTALSAPVLTLFTLALFGPVVGGAVAQGSGPFQMHAGFLSEPPDGLAEHAGSIVDVIGQSAAGRALAVDGAEVSGLTPGTNVVEVVVTAAHGTPKSGYTVAVTRAVQDDDATLLSLEVSEGDSSRGRTLSLEPAFAPDVTSYAASVASDTVYVDLRLRQGSWPNADLTGTDASGGALSRGRSTALGSLNGVLRNSLSAPLSGLTVGLNRIEIEVTAEDGTTTQTYTLAVSRSADPLQ